VKRGHKEEAAQRRIQGASGDDGAFGGEDPVNTFFLKEINSTK
jgi:hypothetical protein